MSYPIESPAWDDRLRREIRLFMHHAGSSQATLGKLIGYAGGYISKVLNPGVPIPAPFIDSLDKHSFFQSIKCEYHYVQIARSSEGEVREIYRAKALDCYSKRSARLAKMLSARLTELENDAK